MIKIVGDFDFFGTFSTIRPTNAPRNDCIKIAAVKLLRIQMM
jgi:hypothetical protein